MASRITPTKILILGGVSLAALIMDQWTKSLILNNFRFGQSVSIIPNFFALTYVRNAGAAFGILHNAPAYFRDPFFVVVPLVALFIIFFIFARLTDEQRLTATALSLILGGALGNLIDRLRFGYVVDFLDFHWREMYHWPAFNIADSCIVVGVALMCLLSFFEPVRPNPETISGA